MKLFSNSACYEAILNKKLKLAPRGIKLQETKDDYNRMSIMLHSGQVTFDAVIATAIKIESILNETYHTQ